MSTTQIMTTTIPASREKATTTPVKFSHADYPPIEDFQTIDGLLKSHARHAEQKPLICYPARGVDDFENHTAADIDRYTDLAVEFYTENGLSPVTDSEGKAPVIALLASSNYEVVLTIFALNRLGYTILFLSTRLTAPAYARLMDLVDCSTVIHSPSFEQMIASICTDRPGCTGTPIIQRSTWFNQPFIKPPYTVDSTDQVRRRKQVAWILHSSGSTGHPKPIWLTNLQCLANFRKSFGMRAFCASPLFHSGGLMELFRAFYTQSTMYLANHGLPVTSANLVAAIAEAKPELVVAVPYVLKLLAERDTGIKTLANARLVLYNGSGCPDDLGDRLVANGVNLVANYGATETGQIMTSFRGIPPSDPEWSYLRLWAPVADYTLMDEIAPGVFECVALDGLPSKGATNAVPPYSEKNPENSYRTADLFTRHPDPQKRNWYRYLSRLDDRIGLVNGEKVLPLPIEGRIRQEDFVREAVVFGFQQTVPGVLVFRPDDKVLDLSDEDYLDLVWPAVEAANARAETFSHILRDLVIIKGPNSVYPRTDKGTFIRAQVYQQFDADIKTAYAKMESGTSQKGVKKLALDVSELEDWLLQRFRRDLKIPLPDKESDVFAAGVDSLQTTRVWRLIKQNLDLGNAGSDMSQNIVFEKGTVAALARYLYCLRTGEAQEEAEDDEVETMRELIGKYSHFTPHKPSGRTAGTDGKEVVILTGATGNLGAFILASLLRRPEVIEVACLVRAKGVSEAPRRIIQSLRSRNIKPSFEEMGKLRCLPSDLSDANLGLGPYDTEHLLQNATCIVHSAWAVNFNLGVKSFEDQHIRGTHNLIQFGLRSQRATPAKFFFCSSVSTASGTPKPATIAEAPVEDLHHAMKTGYGRSKLVTEHITVNAMRETGMEARVLRIGQLSGDTGKAIWNETEAIPLMIRSALSTGALPELDERPSWLPVDTCARAVVELAMSQVAPDGAQQEMREAKLVYHLLNPETISWKNDLLPALKHLSKAGRFPEFETVSADEWLRRLATSEQDPVKNPSVKLTDFWRAKYTSAGPKDAAVIEEEPAGLTFETARTAKDCPVLAKVQQPLAEGLFNRYVDVWMAKWMAETSS